MDAGDPDLRDRRSGEAPSNLLSVEIVTERDGASVVVVGELDISTGGRLLDALRPLLTQATGQVVLECAQLTFLDVGGISVLLDIQQELADRGRHLSVRSLRSNLRRVVEMVDVVAVLDVVD